MKKLGIIGFGKMGSSIIEGVVESKTYEKNDILVYDINTELITKEGYNKALNELDVYENCNMLILAVKPQQYPEVFEKIKNSNNKPSLVISIAAGITLNNLKENLGNNNYVRVMPNLAASINSSYTTLAYIDNIDETYLKIAKTIFTSIGEVKIVEEDQINKLIPIQGSFPAYIWYFINEYIKVAIQKGIKREDAMEAIINTSISSISILKDSNESIETLINNVCSKNGTTIEGIDVFNNNKLGTIIEECYNNCYNRAIELEKK